MSPLYRKITRRLVPFLVLLYMVAFLDRVNISFAALTMNRDLGISESLYGFAAGIFFLGYCLFEVPANLMLARIGARRWIAILLVAWGAVSVSTAFVADRPQYVAARFLLGVAESGFFPVQRRSLRTQLLAAQNPCGHRYIPDFYRLVGRHAVRRRRRGDGDCQRDAATLAARIHVCPQRLRIHFGGTTPRFTQCCRWFHSGSNWDLRRTAIVLGHHHRADDRQGRWSRHRDRQLRWCSRRFHRSVPDGLASRQDA